MIKKYFVSILLIVILLTGCSPQATKDVLMITQTVSVTPVTPTLTLAPSLTPTITPTLPPTSTPFAGFLPNRLIAYKTNWIGPSHVYTGEIEISLPNGDNAVNLTSDQSGNKILGGWSPNGEWIIYGRWEDKGESMSVNSRNAADASPIELWKMNSDGSNKSRLPVNVVANDVRIINRPNNWDSENFLIPCLTGEEQTELCIVNVADSTAQMTGNYGENPSYAPDRKAYAWQVNYDSINAFLTDQNLSDLFVLRAGEFYPIRLPMPTKNLITGYSWLSDSQNLIVLFTEKNLGEIYLIQADGTKEPILILSVTSEVGFWDWSDLSPNGNYLLIHEEVGSTGQDCVANLIEKTHICIKQGWNRFLWTPNGQLVAQKEATAYVFDPVTGEPAQTEQLNWLFSQRQVMLQP
jgi:hypothetical protein